MTGSIVTNTHGTRFEVIGAEWVDSAEGWIPCVQILMVGDHDTAEVGVPFASFARNFKPEVTP